MFENRVGYLAGLGFAQMEAPGVARTLSQIGYRAVEWTNAHFEPRTRSPAELKATVEAAGNEGLATSEVVIQQDYVCRDEATRRDRIALSIETIEACGEAGVSVVNLFTGPAPWDPEAPRIPDDLPEGAAWGMVLDAFSQLLPVLEKHRVSGAVEGVWGHLCDDYYTTRRLIDHFDSPWLGVNFDPSHDVLKGNLDTGWLVREWGKDRIKHVHLKDAVGVPRQGQFLFPFLGEGNVDWRGMHSQLAALPYSGYLSVEFESFAYYERVFQKDVCAAARRCFEDAQALLRWAEVPF